MKPKREDSRKTGWTYRGLMPRQQGHHKNAAGFAWLHVLGMMPGVPDLQVWQEEYLIKSAQTAPTLYAQAHWLVGQEIIYKVIQLATEAAVIEALRLGPLVAQTAWRDGFDLPTTRGFVVASGRSTRHSYAIAGYSERRQAFRIMNSRGPGWGQLGRAWITREVFQALWPSATILFPVAVGVPWAPGDIEQMDLWEQEHGKIVATLGSAKAGSAAD